MKGHDNMDVWINYRYKNHIENTIIDMFISTLAEKMEVPADVLLKPIDIDPEILKEATENWLKIFGWYQREAAPFIKRSHNIYDAIIWHRREK